MFCPECGRETSAGASFCRWCGRSIPQSSAHLPPADTSPPRARWFRRHPVLASAAVVLGVLLGVILIGALLTPGSKNHPQPQPQQALNPQGLRMAVYLARDDMAGRVSGGKAVMLMEDVLRLTKIDIMVDATKYQSDYDANEIAADKRYRGRKILLVGTIRSIEKDFMERGYLTLGADSLLGVRAQLSDRGMAGAESLRAGSRIYLVCDSGERIIGTATADNCQRFSQYSQEIGPSLTEVFTDFLSGRQGTP